MKDTRSSHTNDDIYYKVDTLLLLIIIIISLVCCFLFVLAKRKRKERMEKDRHQKMTSLPTDSPPPIPEPCLHSTLINAVLDLCRFPFAFLPRPFSLVCFNG